ncbi:MAG: hypothetical protein UX75_C0006G0023 [Candidatus Moranbacteria bacterium GW2011_GWE2_47_10]|nr:MAG: hypothetical protein UX75_C0006G0023 [Candidatus Moranbacteria bacterium GW2011_GWE2_47_10]
MSYDWYTSRGNIKSMQICPSILEPKAEGYISQIIRLSPYFKYFQLDFSDGIYVDNKTASLDEFINYLSNQVTKLPTNLIFEFHLMVKDYEKEIEKLEKLKNIITIKNIFIHFDLYPNLSLITSHYSLFNIGLVLNPQDHVSDLTGHYALNDIPLIQIMSIVPGAQGKPFIPDALNMFEQLRKSGYRNELFLDGAVNEKTLPLIDSLKYKPDYICPGSYLTKTNDLKNHVDYLLKFT